MVLSNGYQQFKSFNKLQNQVRYNIISFNYSTFSKTSIQSLPNLWLVYKLINNNIYYNIGVI